MIRHLAISVLFATLSAAPVSILALPTGEHQDRPEEVKVLGAYFRYEKGSVEALRALRTSRSVALDELQAQDVVVTNLVKAHKLPPTIAAKLFAYVLVAQGDAAALSHAAHGEYVGSLAPVTAKVLCLFLPAQCRALMDGETTDDFSRALAELVFARVRARINEENDRSRPYVRQTGDQYWWAARPTTPDAGSWRPWLIQDGSQFRAAPPPRYGSTEDAAEVEIVRTAIVKRTSAQQAAVLFWAGGPGTETPAGIWLRIANEYLRATGVPLELVLAVRSRLAMTMADAFIACWDTKYSYWTKRPFMRDSAIQSSIDTPNFPSYTSGHATVSAAAATILGHYFPGEASRWMAMAYEARDSRLWSGIHFAVDNEHGFRMGLKIGTYVLNRR